MAGFTIFDETNYIMVRLQSRPQETLRTGMQAGADSHIRKGRINNIWETFLAVPAQVEHFPGITPKMRRPVHMKSNREKNYQLPGIFGNLYGTPIINQPQVAILAIGAIKKRPVVINDAIAIRSMVYLSMSYDHRIIDGMLGGKVLQRVTQYMEQIQ